MIWNEELNDCVSKRRVLSWMEIRNSFEFDLPTDVMSLLIRCSWNQNYNIFVKVNFDFLFHLSDK